MSGAKNCFYGDLHLFSHLPITTVARAHLPWYNWHHYWRSVVTCHDIPKSICVFFVSSSLPHSWINIIFNISPFQFLQLEQLVPIASTMCVYSLSHEMNIIFNISQFHFLQLEQLVHTHQQCVYTKGYRYNAASVTNWTSFSIFHSFISYN